MRIAQVAPLFERVPPERYGGTERVVSHLTEKLVDLGHEVTLYASGDSITKADLVSICPRALRLHGGDADATLYHYLLLEKLFRHVSDYDIVHLHVDYLAYPLLRRHLIAHVSTLHGRLDLKPLVPLYGEYSEMPVVSISRAQRKPLPWLNWVGNVHHGLPPTQYRTGDGKGGYLAFLGRVSPEKGLDRAIAIAGRAGMPLRIAAKIDRHDAEYFDSVLRPLIRKSPHVEFIGEVAEHEKSELLGDAHALLFPIDWPEPFGMVMIEAMACGTPVVAMPGGSVREVVEDGVSGFVVATPDEAVRAIERVGAIDRRRCRQAFEQRYTDTRMAADYLRVYRRCLEERELLSGFGDYLRGPRGRDYSTEGPVLRPGDVIAS